VRVALGFALSLAAAAAAAQVREGRFVSESLGREVAYLVDLPPSYEAGNGRYPVVYALHGLFESHAFWQRRGLSAALAALRESGDVPEFLVVAVDGDNSFFVNGPAGRYEDLLTRDLPAHVESAYRVVPGREARALLGVSMGGYAALRLALKRPELFGAVASHSAMLLEAVPTAEQGAGRWHVAAFQRAFGSPIDAALWTEASPFTWAERADPARVPALYLDCGAEDRYGLAAGHRVLHGVLLRREVSHTLDLAPGDHGYDFVRSRIGRSLRFAGEVLRRAAAP
jgi:S-formylglutathione hydrolase FrmB